MDKFVDNVNKGFRLPTTGDWRPVVEGWKKIIKCQMHYKRPFTHRECCKYTNFHEDRVYELLDQMIGENVAEFIPENPYDYYSYYKVDLDAIQKYIKIVDPDDYSQEWYDAECYVVFLKYGDEFYNQALNEGLTKESEIEEFIKDKVAAEVDKIWIRRDKSDRNNSMKESSRKIKVARQKFEQLEHQGIVAKLLRGEITLEQYEKLIHL